jgi:hypothetical protein
MEEGRDRETATLFQQPKNFWGIHRQKTGTQTDMKVIS